MCGYVGKEDKSDAICRKTLATMFAHFAQETGNHNPSDKEYEEWRQVVNILRAGEMNSYLTSNLNSGSEQRERARVHRHEPRVRLQLELRGHRLNHKEVGLWRRQVRWHPDQTSFFLIDRILNCGKNPLKNSFF